MKDPDLSSFIFLQKHSRALEVGRRHLRRRGARAAARTSGNSLCACDVRCVARRRGVGLLLERPLSPSARAIFKLARASRTSSSGAGCGRGHVKHRRWMLDMMPEKGGSWGWGWRLCVLVLLFFVLASFACGKCCRANHRGNGVFLCVQMHPANAAMVFGVFGVFV
jgi:hypothetical protein